MMSSINDLRYWILSKRDTIILTIFGYKVRNRLKKLKSLERKICRTVSLLSSVKSNQHNNHFYKNTKNLRFKNRINKKYYNLRHFL